MPKTKAKPRPDSKRAMQAGARHYPVPPFPRQHLHRPGTESKLDPAPLYEAPYFKGSGKLENEVAIVTGGDSGIGRAVAILFAREGADVVIAYLNEHADARITEQAIQREGRRCLRVAGNVSNPRFCKALASRTVRTFGKLSVLVNNAAFQRHIDAFNDLSARQFDRTLKTNLYGYFHMAQAAVPHMEPGSAIVNTGSVTGLLGNGSLVDYSMTKGGIHAFTRSLATQLVPQGIRVNAVAPGPVWTPLNPADSPPGEVSRFGAKSLMRRPAQPEELSPAYVFLASKQCSSYITGEILPVIGGYHGG